VPVQVPFVVRTNVKATGKLGSSTATTLVAVPGPRLVTTKVHVIGSFVSTELRSTRLVTARSAVGGGGTTGHSAVLPATWKVAGPTGCRRARR
jgi:hypothetical protein